MAFEARIAAGPGVRVAYRKTEHDIAKLVEGAVRQGCCGIVSFGVAGGLMPRLRAGDWIVASSIVAAQTVHATDETWSRKLLRVIPSANHAPIAGVDFPVSSPAAKRELHAKTGAAAVDMESHVVARIAARHRLSFTALRVVIDPIERVVPPAALAAMDPDGNLNVFAIMRALMANPSQVTALARVAVDAMAACAELIRVRRLLGPQFGLVDLR
ncbi:MAG: adenosylhopane nucleosidase [Pseudolabrys sp.]|nr:adenosylhopane nucleosidase [Pseudolabrys sp.]